MTAAALCFAPTAAAAPVDPTPPYIDHVEWVRWNGEPSLRIYPTAAGRAAAVAPGGDALSDGAWAEVLALAPDADGAGMHAQFRCHWSWAEFGEPGKASWNLEPWRPVVSADRLLLSGCNPGADAESF